MIEPPGLCTAPSAHSRWSSRRPARAGWSLRTSARELLNRGRVEVGHPVRVEASRTGGDAARRVEVLDRHRDGAAAPGSGRRNRRLGGARGVACALGRNRDEGVEPGLQLFEAGERHFGHLDRRDSPAASRGANSAMLAKARSVMAASRSWTWDGPIASRRRSQSRSQAVPHHGRQAATIGLGLCVAEFAAETLARHSLQILEAGRCHHFSRSARRPRAAPADRRCDPRRAIRRCRPVASGRCRPDWPCRAEVAYS